MRIFSIIIGIIMTVGALTIYPYDLYKELNSIRLVGGDAYNLIISSNIICAKYVCSCLLVSFGCLIFTLTLLSQKEKNKKWKK